MVIDVFINWDHCRKCDVIRFVKCVFGYNTSKLPQWLQYLFNFCLWPEVKVKSGSPFCKYFLTINDLYNGAKIVNLSLVVVEIWFVLNIKLWLPVWTGSKGQIGSHVCKYLLTINNLYTGAKIVNLPLAVVEIWFFWNIKLWLRVWTEYFWQLMICTMVHELWIYLLWLLRYD